MQRPHSELVGSASLLTSERPRRTRVWGPDGQAWQLSIQCVCGGGCVLGVGAEDRVTMA